MKIDKLVPFWAKVLGIVGKEEIGNDELAYEFCVIAKRISIFPT